MRQLNTFLQNLRSNESFSDDLGLEEVPFEKELVDFVDKLVELAKKNGSKDKIQRDADWEVIKFMYKGFSILYPNTHREFEKKMSHWKDCIGDSGVRKEKDAMIQHKLEVPMPFYRMIQIIFPKQDWDKGFVNALARVLPVMVAGRKV